MDITTQNFHVYGFRVEDLISFCYREASFEIVKFTPYKIFSKVSIKTVRFTLKVSYIWI